MDQRPGYGSYIGQRVDVADALGIIERVLAQRPPRLPSPDLAALLGQPSEHTPPLEQKDTLETLPDRLEGFVARAISAAERSSFQSAAAVEEWRALFADTGRVVASTSPRLMVHRRQNAFMHCWCGERLVDALLTHATDRPAVVLTEIRSVREAMAHSQALIAHPQAISNIRVYLINMH